MAIAGMRKKVICGAEVTGEEANGIQRLCVQSRAGEAARGAGRKVQLDETVVYDVERSLLFFCVSSTKRRLNVDSPSFTPALLNPTSLSVNGSTTKVTGLSPKAANAAPFQPKGLNPSEETCVVTPLFS